MSLATLTPGIVAHASVRDNAGAIEHYKESSIGTQAVHESGTNTRMTWSTTNVVPFA